MSAFPSLDLCGSFNTGQKKALVEALGQSGATITPTASPVTLTDSTGGTASNTLAAITAGASYAQADATATKNGLASLAAKVNALLTACKTAGILT